MSSKENSSNYDKQLGYCGPTLHSDSNDVVQPKKPLEIYTFIDPLCPECWAVEPIVKKLQMEYGAHFKIRYFVACKLDVWNLGQTNYHRVSTIKKLADIWEKTASRTGMSCDGDLWYEDPISSPYAASIAIKAAEMQGKQAGARFLRKLRELLFLDKQNITKEPVLLHCAAEAALDVDEFKHDLHSDGAVKALQCDIKATIEMEVDGAPTFVFFNDRIEDAGIKVAGVYPYNVYVQVMGEMLGDKPVQVKKIPLIEFLETYKFVATTEVAVVYDISSQEAEKQLKELKLKQRVERVPVKFGTFWRFLK